MSQSTMDWVLRGTGVFLNRMEMKASMTVVDVNAQHEAQSPWVFTGLRFFFQSKATGSMGLKDVGYCRAERRGACGLHAAVMACG